MAYSGKTGGRALNRFLANQGLIQTLDSNQANIASADIGEINAGVINATDSTVVDLSAINLNVANEFVSETIVTSNATFTNINTTGATITDGTIATLTGTSGSFTNADITNLYTLNGQIPNATLGTTTATSLIVNGNITFTGSISGNVEAEVQENIDQRISANDADISALQIDLTDVSQRLFDSQNQDDADLTDLSSRVLVNEADIIDVSQRLFDSQNQDDADLTDLSARVFVNEGDIIDFSTDYLRLDGGTMTGNLGIGTASGSNALHVNGTTKSSHVTSDTITVGRTDISNGFNSFEVDGNARVYGELRVDGSLNLGANTITLIDDGDGTLRLQHTNGTGVVFDLATDNPSIKPLLTTHTDSKVLIDNTTQENTNPQLDLASEGRVGIGTADASGSLHISGDTYITNGKLMIGSNTEPTYDADIQGIIRSINSAYLATSSGNVGIGTTSPEYKLDVNGTMRATGATTLGSTLDVTGITKINDTTESSSSTTGALVVDGGVGIAKNLHVNDDVYISSGKSLYVGGPTTTTDGVRIHYSAPSAYIDYNGSEALYFRTGDVNGSNPRMVITEGGNVGIGTVSPNAPLHVEGSSRIATTNGYYFTTGTDFTTYVGGTQDNISIWANGLIVSENGFIASSDKRIKQNINHISDSNALDLFRTIQPRTYEYIDKHSRGTNTVYGFIAQEVKDVIPNAVTITKNIIPDYYKPVKYDVIYDASTNITTLDIEHDISYNIDASHNVRLYILDNSSQETKIDTAPQIIDDTHFSIQSNEIKDVSGVFLYGKEVDDFHTLNKDAIWTVASAALQEVDRNVEKLRKKNHIVRGNISLVDSSGSIILPLEETEFTNPQVFLQNNDGWSQVKGSISGNTLTIIAKDSDCTDTIDYMISVDLIE